MIRSVTWKWIALAAVLAISSGNPAGAQIAFDGNIVFDNLPANCDPTVAGIHSACTIMSAFTHNDQVNPQLIDPYNRTSPNWVPAATSPALGSNDDVVNAVVHADACYTCGPCAPFLTPVCYRGGVPPASYGADWTQGWTYYNLDGTGRTDIDYDKPLEILTGAFVANRTLTNDKNYLLRGRVSMTSGFTLTIQPGTACFGENSTSGYLVIERGAKINAVGTKQQPIILTTDLPPGSMERGGWGGLVIHGRAIANCADCLGGQSCVSEGGAGDYCGTNDCDDSGVLRYVRVEYAGVEISKNNELNAFTFNAVGCGTDAEFLQAHMGSDDTFEWFGGKMNARYLVSTGGGDDNIDWQMGYRGQIQFVVTQTYDDSGEKGIEADNNEFNFNAVCRSNPVIANVTFVGPGSGIVSTALQGIHLRRGTDAQIYNSIVIGFPQYGFRVQNAETTARGVYADPGVFCNATDVQPVELGAELVVRTFPNPVVNEARFFFQLPAAARTQIAVFDLGGRHVSTVLDEELGPGTHQTSWTLPPHQASAAYFYRLQSGDEVATGRIITAR